MNRPNPNGFVRPNNREPRAKTDTWSPSIGPLRCRVIVFNIAEDREAYSFVANLANHESAAKLQKTLIWAARNRHAVEIINVDDDKPLTDRE